MAVFKEQKYSFELPLARMLHFDSSTLDFQVCISELHFIWIMERHGASFSVNAYADFHVTVMFNVWIDLFSDVNMAVERRQAKPQSQPSPPRR